MGISGISTAQLLILLGVVIVIFGTRKLRGMGSDLGTALRDFRKGVSDDE